MDFIDLATRCAPSVHPATLAAIVQHESNLNPYAIGINSKRFSLRRQPANQLEAVALSGFLREHKVDFDSGLGQINVRNLRRLNLSEAALFDPCKNIKASAKLLTDCYTRATYQFGEGKKALHAALSCYNTGNFHQGFSNGYVSKILAQAERKIPSILSSQPEKPHMNAAPTNPKKTFEKKDIFEIKNKPDAFKKHQKSV